MKKHAKSKPVPVGNQSPFGPRSNETSEASANAVGETPTDVRHVGAADAPFQPGGAHDADRKPSDRRGSGKRTPRPKQR